MANILISNLAILKPFDVKIYVELILQLQKAGHQCVFWSNNTAPELESWFLPLEWYFEKETRTYAAPEKNTIAEALKYIESAKWSVRIGHYNEIADPQQAEKYMQFHAGVSLKLIEAFKPDLFIAFNPLAPHTGIPYEICKAKDISTITIERSQFLPLTLALDSGGLMGHSEITGKTIEQLVQLSEREKFALLGEAQIAQLNPKSFLRNNAGVKEDAQLPVEAGKIKVAVFGIDDRAVGMYPQPHSDNKFGLPLFSSSIAAAAAFAEELDNATVIYKSHPSLTEKYNKLSTPSEKLHITNATPEKIIEWADIIVSAGTSVETLALAAAKPVVLCGESPFKNKHICYELNRTQDIKEVISAAYSRNGYNEMQQNLRIFLGYCFSSYCITAATDVEGTYTVKQAAERINNNLLVQVKSINKKNTIDSVKRKLLFHGSIWAKIKEKLK